jgi:hypothetical protein
MLHTRHANLVLLLLLMLSILLRLCGRSAAHLFSAASTFNGASSVSRLSPIALEQSDASSRGLR